jgi:hypothetical protein
VYIDLLETQFLVEMEIRSKDARKTSFKMTLQAFRLTLHPSSIAVSILKIFKSQLIYNRFENIRS